MHSEWPVVRRFRLQKLAPEWQLEMTNGELVMAGIYLQKNPTTSVGLRRWSCSEYNEGYWLLIIQYLDSSLCSEWRVVRRFRLQKLAPEWQGRAMTERLCHPEWNEGSRFINYWILRSAQNDKGGGLAMTREIYFLWCLVCFFLEIDCMVEITNRIPIIKMSHFRILFLLSIIVVWMLSINQ